MHFLLLPSTKWNSFDKYRTCTVIESEIYFIFRYAPLHALAIIRYYNESSKSQNWVKRPNVAHERGPQTKKTKIKNR